MGKKTKIFLIIFFLVAIVMISYLSTLNYKSIVTVNGKIYNVDVADTSYTLKKGLSGKTRLGESEGMIFIFGKPDKYGFWMKEMNFPIDIIWIGEDFEVNHIERRVEPSTYPTVFYPEEDSLYVLELSSGQSDLLGLKKGDKVEFLR